MIVDKGIMKWEDDGMDMCRNVEDSRRRGGGGGDIVKNKSTSTTITTSMLMPN